MRYKRLPKIRKTISALRREILGMTHDIEDADDLHGAMELWEICAMIAEGLRRLQEFDVGVAERRLSKSLPDNRRQKRS